MGCPGGTRLVFAPAFRAKRELHCIFQAKKGNHYYIQTRHNDLFFPLKIFLMGKLKEKLAEKRA